jgi:Zn-dependent protease
VEHLTNSIDLFRKWRARHTEEVTVCQNCGSAVDEHALRCPNCQSFTHLKDLEALVAEARAAEGRGDAGAAQDAWERAALLLPPESTEYQGVLDRIAELRAKRQRAGGWKKSAAGIGSTLLVMLSKGKMVLLGLTKLSTLLSMLAFVGVYWALYGWRFAVGIVFSIYIHEMGHVLKLREYGIAASAPMFIPGLGAFIRMKSLHITRVQDARVGLAGPIYGLGAAAIALAGGFLTGAKAWYAIAHFGAVINLFNLIPVWQLDGSRGFASQTRQQRLTILVAAAVLWWVTGETFLILIVIAAIYRLFTKDAAEEPDQTG